jgi:hypothetical protein
VIPWLLSIFGALLSDAMRTRSELEEFYPDTAGGTMKRSGEWLQLHGSSVVWFAEPGEAVWIEAGYLRPTWGNIFDSDKLGSVAKAVRGATEPLLFMAPWGNVSRIDRDDIAESIEYAEWNAGTPWTTGDDDVDLYLKDPEQWLEDNAWDDESRAELQAEKEAELVEAEAEGAGDFGHWTATLRNGNHRAFGSVIGGEQFVVVRVDDGDVAHVQEDLRRGTWRMDNQALLQKMITDTGTAPWWLERLARVHPRMLSGEPPCAPMSDCPDCEVFLLGQWRTGVCDDCKRMEAGSDCDNCQGTGAPVCCLCEGTGRSLPPTRRVAQRPHSFQFWAQCTDFRCGDIIHYITDDDRATEITYDTFAKWTDLRELRASGHGSTYRMGAPGNWAISFWRSELPTGQRIYYFDWSRIEHIFLDPEEGWPELREMDELARKLARD